MFGNYFPITDTVRHLILIVGSGLLSFFVALLIAPAFIRLLRHFKIQKKIRRLGSDGKTAALFHQLHEKKEGTPTMGGILIWGTTLFVVLFSQFVSEIGIFEHSLISREETYLPLFTLLTVGFLGGLDDFYNIKGWGKSMGLNIKPKFLTLLVFAAVGAWWFYFKLGHQEIHIPGMGDFMIGAWYIPLFIFIILATSNAVNITDGLDGLAGGLTVIAFASYAALAYADGVFILSAFCAVIAGATIAFLWFNIHPAQFYMGDTGALALGATLGVIAMQHSSIVELPFITAIFVIETLSVIIQVFSKKVFKKKVFHIAPLHHHLEHIGWPEPQVVMRLWITGGLIACIGVILGLVGMGN